LIPSIWFKTRAFDDIDDDDDKDKKIGSKRIFLSQGPICLIIISFGGHFAHKCKISRGYLHIT